MARPFIVLDKTFHDLVPLAARIERVAGGFGFTEGPVWRGDHLIFSDIHHSRLVRWQELPEGPEVRTFRVDHVGVTDPPGIGHVNGTTLDLEDRLIVCGQGARHLTRTEHDGSITVLASHYEGKRLNSPNDVVVHSSGAIYFTDPPWGLRKGSEGKELPFQGVYRLGTDGTLALLTDLLEHPNGLAFTPDEQQLYVGDDLSGNVYIFDVRQDGTLANGHVFAHTPLPSPLGPEDGPPDGMKVDSAGNLYLTSIGGVWIFAPDARPLGLIQVPEVVANAAWGEAGWQTLFLTASTSLYRIRLNTTGIPVGSARLRR